MGFLFSFVFFCFLLFSFVFFCFFCFFFVFFLFFFVFILFICPEERGVFRVFTVSRKLLGAPRLLLIITFILINLFLLIYASALD